MKAISIIMGTVLMLMGLIVMTSYGPDSIHPMKGNLLYGGGAVVMGLWLLGKQIASR